VDQFTDSTKLLPKLSAEGKTTTNTTTINGNATISNPSFNILAIAFSVLAKVATRGAKYKRLFNNIGI